MGSTRLPQKSMLPLAGKPLVGRILERVKMAKSIDEIVLAIPKTKNDDVLLKLSEEYEVACFRGSENDLVDRYYRAAQAHGAELVLRLPADNVCSEAREFDKLIDAHLIDGNDFSSNICNFMGNGYPDGIGVEVFTFESLAYIWRSERDMHKREHVALNYYDYLNDSLPKNPKFKVGTIQCRTDYARPDITLDVNTEDDYRLMADLYADLQSGEEPFEFRDVINWWDCKFSEENYRG